MKRTFKRSLKRTLAFVSALTILAAAFTGTVFPGRGRAVRAADSARHADDYTSLFPGLRDTKLKLRDPKFSSKDWYEYIDYELYTEVQDGDITYRISKPTDFSQASIMAIGDYNPKEVLGNTTNIAMDMGELQGILDLAAQGGNISKNFAGLSIAGGIAGKMTSIDKIMDNSKYYSQSSFLGIPGDKKYSGISNDGFFNADSLEIEITESETISACKTIAMDSTYSISDSTVNGKDSATYQEACDGKTNTIEESTYDEKSKSAGQSIGVATTDSVEISKSVAESVGWEIIAATSVTNEMSVDVSNTFEASAGWDANYVKDALTVGVHEGVSVTDSLSVGQSGSLTVETGQSMSQSLEQSVQQNLEESNTQGKSSGKSESIEHSLTSGNSAGVSYSHAQDMSVGVGYGVDYQYGNEHSLSVGVTRTFNAREDDEVKNVGWKLCEYVVKIPYYIEAVRTAENGEETVLYGQYVNYNLLNGICRVFANGYIEHWYTGQLVTYADFFDGFVTASELVDKAKAQQADKAAKEG